MKPETRNEIEEAATKEAFNLCLSFLSSSGYAGAAAALTKFLTDEPSPPAEPAPTAPTMGRTSAQQMGFTGNMCPECREFMMVRNGTCEKCNACGATTGCS